jgi:hypothetical protein
LSLSETDDKFEDRGDAFISDKYGIEMEGTVDSGIAGIGMEFQGSDSDYLVIDSGVFLKNRSADAQILYFRAYITETISQGQQIYLLKSDPVMNFIDIMCEGNLQIGWYPNAPPPMQNDKEFIVEDTILECPLSNY